MKAEADFIQSMRAGAVDSAVEVLKRVHDAKQLQARARLKGGAAPLLGVPAAPAMGSVLYALASAQSRVLAELLKQQQAVTRTMHEAVADALGVARGGAAPQVITWHARRAEAGRARRRFVVRNARDAAAVELTLRPFTRVGSEAVLLGPHASMRVDGRALLSGVEGTHVGVTVAEGAAIVEGAEGVLPRGGTALVEIELDLKALLDEAGADRYASRLDVALFRGPAASRSREAATALTLELVVHD